MTTRFADKQPGDKPVVEFDFSAFAATVTSPTITIAVASGTDAGPDLEVLGSPEITGAKVRQQLQGGLDGVVYRIECAVAEGHSVDALLPVIERPLLSDATPRYLSQAAFEQQFGVRETQDLIADGNDYARAENAAAGIVDGYIGARYTLPLTSVPGIVLGWVGDITRYRLWDEAAPDEVRRRYEDAIAQLRDVSTGKMALPGTDGATPATAEQFNADGYSNARVFTSTTLACY